MTKRKLDNIELEDTASSSNDQKIDYNKNIIEKILYKSTNKNIEVFLSYSNEQKQYTTHNSATDELIERIKYYILKQQEESQCYLIVNLNKKEMVDIAYLGHLHYSNKYQNRKLDVVPLINYKQVRSEFHYISDMLITTDVSIPGAKIYNDLNMIEKPMAQVIEYAKLRIKYFVLNKSNFEQYRLALTTIEAKATEDLAKKAHKKILEQSPSDNNKYLEATKLNVLQITDDTACSSRGNEDYDKQDTYLIGEI